MHILWGKQNRRISKAYGPQADGVFEASQDISLAYNSFIGRGAGYLLNGKLHSVEIPIVPRWLLIKRGMRERQIFDIVKKLFYQDSIGFLPVFKPEPQLSRLK